MARNGQACLRPADQAEADVQPATGDPGRDTDRRILDQHVDRMRLFSSPLTNIELEAATETSTWKGM